MYLLNGLFENIMNGSAFHRLENISRQKNKNKQSSGETFRQHKRSRLL